MRTKEREMWSLFAVEVMVDRLTAGIPANEKLLEAWLSANGAPADAAVDQAAVLERLDPEETHGVVFYRDSDGRPAYESRNFKAALKEGANILKPILDVKNFKSKLAERVFVGPALVPVVCNCNETDRSMLPTPDHNSAGVHVGERPISVMTMQGPRTSLKRFEFAFNVPMKFQVKILNDGMVKPEHVQDILEYLQEGGIGADRSQGSGTMRVVSFEALEPTAVR